MISINKGQQSSGDAKIFLITTFCGFHNGGRAFFSYLKQQESRALPALKIPRHEQGNYQQSKKDSRESTWHSVKIQFVRMLMNFDMYDKWMLKLYWNRFVISVMWSDMVVQRSFLIVLCFRFDVVLRSYIKISWFY